MDRPWVELVSDSLLLVLSIARRVRRLTGIAIGWTIAILVAAALAILRAGPIGRAVTTLGTVDGLFLF